MRLCKTWQDNKKGHVQPFSACFPVFGVKTAGKKTALNPDTRVGLVIVLPRGANSEFLGFVQLEIPKPWKIMHIPTPEWFQNYATPSTVGTICFLGGTQPIEQPDLLIKSIIPNFESCKCTLRRIPGKNVIA